MRGPLKPIPLHKDGVAIMAHAVSPGTTPLTHAERGQLGILERLATEDWSAMTAAAQASPRNVKGMERWRDLARQNTHLDDEQVERLAVRLRREHFRKMGQLSAAARKLAREAAAEMERGSGSWPTGCDRHGVTFMEYGARCLPCLHEAGYTEGLEGELVLTREAQAELDRVAGAA